MNVLLVKLSSTLSIETTPIFFFLTQQSNSLMQSTYLVIIGNVITTGMACYRYQTAPRMTAEVPANLTYINELMKCTYGKKIKNKL